MWGLAGTLGVVVVLAGAAAPARAVELMQGQPYVTSIDGLQLTLLFEEKADNAVVSTTVQQLPDGRPVRNVAVLDPDHSVSVMIAPLLNPDDEPSPPLTLRLTRRAATVLAEIGRLLDNGHFALVERDA